MHMMSFEDFFHAYKGFFKVLTLEIGLKCPIACRHCWSNCRPDRVEQMDINVLRTAIRQFGAIENSEIVALTGGEPFIYPDRLLIALEEINRFPHLKSGVITNGFWATSKRKAIETLESLPRINQVCVSTDIYHKEFIPTAFIKNALLACEDLGISTFLAVCIENYEMYQDELKQTLGEDLFNRTIKWFTDLQKIGRAVTFPTHSQRLSDNVLWDSCFIAGSPFILYDGTVVTCCNCTRLRRLTDKPLSTEFISPLEVGRLSTSTLQDMFLEMNEDVIIQTLRTIGIGGIFNILKKIGMCRDDVSSYNHVCDLCIELLTAPQIVKRLRELLTSPTYFEHVTLKRAYYYGESVEP